MTVLQNSITDNITVIGYDSNGADHDKTIYRVGQILK